ncbi:MAG TPA: GNAT family N-acetyltransferase [Caulobacterales bacterium]|nr:GNAT family N-acetyltransferase [Caulobacterales bacterium]
MIATVGADQAGAMAALHARAFDPAWGASEIAKLLENPAAFAIMSSDPHPQGFILAWTAADQAEILTLAVTPRERFKGVGSGLINAACAAALLRGAAAMLLDVAEDNAPARALYAKFGFVEIGRRVAYYHRDDGRVDALVLRRDLPRPIF